MIKKSLFKKPNIKLEGVSREEQPIVPEQIFIKCPACKKIILEADLERSARVCDKCGHHMRLSARRRIALISDAGSFTEHDGGMDSKNLLDFPGYEGKLKKAAQESGESEGVITGTALIDGSKCALFSMESRFMMGSMGTVVGDKITRLFEHAALNRLPVIGFTVSGGARMQEGILSLMQMAKVSAAVGRHSDEGLLYIVILTDPTTGGVTASFAMEGDIILAEPGALVAFAGPRVIEQTIRKKLPEGFQRSEMLLEKGFVDRIVQRSGQRQALSLLLRMHCGNGGDSDDGV
ncbi:MAG: acetyl-CoA carboxylase, carboxyltransferase subunit beta [Christensenellales bacterium]|jgi:acetyl-CoA carboxylase carboxyl transferase beta subunit